jgi:hypothetical protein
MINTVEKIYDKLPPNSFMYKVVLQGNTITDPGE